MMIAKMDVVLPKQLSHIQPWDSEFPKTKYSWLTNEEIAQILISFYKHDDWLSDSRVQRPENGQLFMFNRKKVKYRKDMYIWKTRKKRKLPREDHVKLKVCGIPCIAAAYVHSDVLPTFHRRCYWFIQNPDIILVHYLNYPYLDNGEYVSENFSLNKHCHQWRDLTKQDVLEQIIPMFSNLSWPNATDQPLTKEMVEVVATHLVQRHFDSRIENRYSKDKPRAIQPKSTNNCGFILYHGQKMSTPVEQSTVTNFIASSSSNNQVIHFENPIHFQNQTSVVDIFKTFPSQLPSKPTVSENNQQSCQLASSMLNPPNFFHDFAVKSCHNELTYIPEIASNVKTSVVNHNFLPGNTSNSTFIMPDKACQSAVPATLNGHNEVDISDSTCPPKRLEKSDASCNFFDAHSVFNESQTLHSSSSLYGVSDVLVTKCNEPRCTPIASTSCPSDLTLDDFDIDNLFFSTKPLLDEKCASDKKSDNDSAIDFFPSQLLDCEMPAVDSLLNLNDQRSLMSPDKHIHTELDANLQRDLSVTLETIADYSPDWSYVEGGIKVLVTGTWEASGNYMCSFDDHCVPATVVQSGVLRCFCPAHSVGHVDLTVVRDNAIISHPVDFEYKEHSLPCITQASQWFQMDENSFKMSILDRLERVEEKLNSIGDSLTTKSNTQQNSNKSHTCQKDNTNSSQPGDFETTLKSLCRRLITLFDERNLKQNSNDWLGTGMTLLHYIAALGYSQLLQYLQSMRPNSSNLFLQNECDPMSCDQMGCTPLMWSCAKGHMSCVEILSSWDRSALFVHDQLGRLPLGIAFLQQQDEILHKLLQLASPSTSRSEREEDGDESSLELSDSSVVETIDSGEDTMETDDNFSLLDADSSLFTLDEIVKSSGRGSKPIVDSNLRIGGIVIPPDVFDDILHLSEQISEVLSSNDDDESIQLNITNQGVSLSQIASFRSNTSFIELTPYQSVHFGWIDFLRLPPCRSSFLYKLGNDEMKCDCHLSNHELLHLVNASRTLIKAHQNQTDSFNTDLLLASSIIQQAYRKFEKFLLSKKMNKAAVLIQSKFRSYQEQKKFQRRRHAAILIQSFYRSYKDARASQRPSKQTVRFIEDALRGTHVVKRLQHQAARKIQRFLRQCQLRSRRMQENGVRSKLPEM